MTYTECWRDITAFGSVPFAIVVLLLTLVLGLQRLFWHLVIGGAIILAIVVLIRTVYPTHRPIKQKYSTFIQKIDAASFPSLHSAGSMYLALSLMSSDWRFNGLLIVIALLIAYSRIHLKKHYWTDVIVGLFLGACVFWVMSVVF